MLVALGHGHRQRRRDRRRVPDRRRADRRRRHHRAVCRHRRHQPLHHRPARAAGARERRRGQRLGLVDGAGAVRRQRVRSRAASPATRPGSPASSSATAFAQAADGRIFVAQQGGAIRVIKNGALLPTPFATVTVDSSGERGLIGIALHPDFAANGYVYIYSTRTDGGAHNRISRFTAAGDVAAAGSEVALVDLPNLSGATNHNGGGMHFGSDGKLYVGVGENANSALAQDLAHPFGKLLRFNDDGTIPTDNPFYATPERPGARDLGLRPAQPVHLRGPARHRPHPHQRRRPEHLGGDQPRRGRRQLRLAGLRRAEQRRRRHHRAAVRLPAQRHQPARLGPGRLLHGLRDRRRRVLSGERPVPRRLPRPVLLRRFRQQVRRPARRRQRQCGLLRSPGSRARRSTCWWASTARSTC